MSQDSFTEVTHESWLGRLGGAVKGVLLGTILFGISFPLLFWNEGRAVSREKALKEGASAVVSVEAGNVSPANSAKLVHVSGKASTSETLSDPLFGISANAIHLQRQVAMYQWREKSEHRSQKRLGGGTDTTTTYTYDKTWDDELVDSSRFKHPEGHENPPAMPCKSEDWSARDVRLGAFQLSASLVGKISHFSPLPVTNAAAVSNAALGMLQFDHGALYRGRNPSAPEIGDVRVGFELVEPAEVSVVAQQAGTMLSSYVTKSGGSIELLQTGVHSAAEMFQSAQQSNRILTWLLRGVGFVVMLIGLSMVLRPLSVLADVVPFIGSIVEVGTGLISFLVSLVLSALTIAIAWIVYRPALGVLLVVIAVGIAFVLKTRLARAKRQPVAAQP